MTSIESVYSKLLELYEAFNPCEWLWLVSYSGGKDSTTLLLLTLKLARERAFKVSVVYNDCGGDLPAIRALVFDVLNFIKQHSDLKGVVEEVFITRPERSFFDYLLTRYSPPRWNFRWCCKRLKEYPFRRLINELAEKRKVLNLVGNRREEARWRNWFMKRVSDRVVYAAPLRDLKNDEVWCLLREIAGQLGFEWVYQKLWKIYKEGTIRRSGCWFCTVVGLDGLLLSHPDLMLLKYEILESWCNGRRENILELSKKHPELVKVSVSVKEVSRRYPCGKKCKNCQVRLVREAIRALLSLSQAPSSQS
jgi:3'-phosphoadenosine 5'-phosphosulfate sulfotransferase (PAPS reductase)/FAD synthetase/bacterioferritin-associated ferredoxin